MSPLSAIEDVVRHCHRRFHCCLHRHGVSSPFVPTIDGFGFQGFEGLLEPARGSVGFVVKLERSMETLPSAPIWFWIRAEPCLEVLPSFGYRRRYEWSSGLMVLFRPSENLRDDALAVDNGIVVAVDIGIVSGTAFRMSCRLPPTKKTSSPASPLMMPVTIAAIQIIVAVAAIEVVVAAHAVNGIITASA